MNGRSARGLLVVVWAVVVLLATAHLAWADFFEFQKLLASDGASGDNFGTSVAVYGDYAIVGAPRTGSGSDIGAAYVFNWNGSTWSQQAKLTLTGGAADDYFGQSVAIYGDYAVVGAMEQGGPGSAYVFSRSGSTWSQQATLTASDGADDHRFGYSVGISGENVIVGAHQSDIGGKGAAYLFERPGTGWADMTETAKLTASDAVGSDAFGWSVGISEDQAIVGAMSKAAAYVFEKPGGGWTDMTETAKLTASGGNFGCAVGIYGDEAIVGAYGVDSDTGAAYVFTGSGDTWTEQATLTASDGADGDNFGRVVGIWGDYAIVTAPNDDSCAGSAYVFKWSGTSWTEVDKLTASDGAAWDYFGQSVGIWSERAIVGAWYNDDRGDASGSAYMYHTPEPSGMVALAGLGLMGCAAHLWRRRKRKT